MTSIFDGCTLHGVTLHNRIGVSPMCEYSSEDGMPGDWRLVHLGSRAAGGAGLALTEAASVEPRGRISPQDAGIWSDAHAEAWARVTRFLCRIIRNKRADLVLLACASLRDPYWPLHTARELGQKDNLGQKDKAAPPVQYTRTL